MAHTDYKKEDQTQYPICAGNFNNLLESDNGLHKLDYLQCCPLAVPIFLSREISVPFILRQYKVNHHLDHFDPLNQSVLPLGIFINSPASDSGAFGRPDSIVRQLYIWPIAGKRQSFFLLIKCFRMDKPKKVYFGKSRNEDDCTFDLYPYPKMNKYQFREFQIEVWNETSYSPNSVDNNFTYSKHYHSWEALDSPVSKHGVRLFFDGNCKESCIVIGCGGATGISSNSSLLDHDRLLICCGDSVFCLSLPTLDLHWVVRADLVTCFQIFKYDNDYIIHGELQITRLDRSGHIVWEFGGMDIFVSYDGEAFKIKPDGILLTDFGGRRYKLDFGGSGMMVG